ncbi:hypothetical protein B0H16DRAFT_1448990 [Mycena metata]|uniref:Secreted protein n=1 Tax=Mycena metata TaxID=1033252 RepID=A0AAD7K518_9AGAR|nr:hypothetical protein B0H16DRAFT_1448990 [Mycena metata]
MSSFLSARSAFLFFCVCARVVSIQERAPPLVDVVPKVVAAKSRTSTSWPSTTDVDCARKTEATYLNERGRKKPTPGGVVSIPHGLRSRANGGRHSGSAEDVLQ